MFYFAYGSNMNESQMVERCPSTRFVGVAAMQGRRLAFTRRSVNRNCGVADAVKSPEHKLWGIVYELSDADVTILDRSEGYQPGRTRNSYWRRPCTVLLDGDDSRPIGAETYFAEAQPEPPRPSQAYKLLIVQGARRRLPPEYVAELEQIQADP
jgi:Gamma-glutamyl cyclotransferase, AIG2-like